jgi:hypothetical protein
MLRHVDTIALAIVRATYRVASAASSATQGKRIAKQLPTMQQQRGKKEL